MGHNGCDGSQASGPWAIGSGYRFSMLLHQSPYLPTCKAKANEGAFAAEEPSHSPRIIRFSE